MKRSIFCGMRISAFIALPSLGARELQRDREAEIGNERERMRRIDRQRRQQRKDVLRKWSSSQVRSAFFRLAGLDQHDAGGRELLAQARASAPAGRWRAATTASPIRASCSAGVRPSGLCVGDARRAPGP